MNIKQKLIDVLETIIPNEVYLQGTFSEDEYPESFITIWTDDTTDGDHFDNDVASISWTFSVNYYSSDPSTMYSTPELIRTKLKANGFIPQGRGYDIPSDVETHTGWSMEFNFRENL